MISIFLIMISCFSLDAHQPRLPQNFPVLVENPEISKAYYSIGDSSQEYIIESKENFRLYVNILVPDLAENNTNFIVEISKNGQIFAILKSNIWKKFYEHYAGDHYLMGPELDTITDPGIYLIKVKGNGKYILAIGKKEHFTLNEIIKTYKVLPKIKREFFDKPSIYAFLNRITLFLALPIVTMILAGWIIRKV